jgi:hypothetical protein
MLKITILLLENRLPIVILGIRVLSIFHGHEETRAWANMLQG